MENPNAQKLVNKIQKDLFKNGLVTQTLVVDLKKLREYALEAQIPVLVKALRLAYEHIEENDAFLIPIPDDEPLESEDGEEITQEIELSTENNLESLDYFISLLLDLENKTNIADLREYNKLFKKFQA
ncbi:hypothetical protein K5I29_04335 [Flavobacterium agricola]|uniref:Uncharacterized protein n=1 Tax=Flavobacterium agricola TaxID=2870839 RepID=A0ABY6M0Q4_9FLAO|nr:hypothetical protein [Flavobacterium agricola]UYW02135.1 hypothetical protein K5I29_04335 [Flavobacterium agricola]